MLGKSHLIVGLTAGVVLDSVMHVSGSPLTMASRVPLSLIVNKAIFYFMVGFGALLPDIDNARSTLGRKLGWVSKGIQRLAGHRTLFHSIIGLVLGSLLAIGLERVISYLLLTRGYTVPAEIIQDSHLVFIAVLFGCIMHIVADGLTEGGVPLLWPNHTRFGFPPSPKWRFRTGDWPEHVIVYGFMILVGVGIYYGVIHI